MKKQINLNKLKSLVSRTILSIVYIAGVVGVGKLLSFLITHESIVMVVFGDLIIAACVMPLVYVLLREICEDLAENKKEKQKANESFADTFDRVYIKIDKENPFL